MKLMIFYMNVWIILQFFLRLTPELTLLNSSQEKKLLSFMDIKKYSWKNCMPVKKMQGRQNVAQHLLSCVIFLSFVCDSQKLTQNFNTCPQRELCLIPEILEILSQLVRKWAGGISVQRTNPWLIYIERVLCFPFQLCLIVLFKFNVKIFYLWLIFHNFQNWTLQICGTESPCADSRSAVAMWLLNILRG